MDSNSKSKFFGRVISNEEFDKLLDKELEIVNKVTSRPTEGFMPHLTVYLRSSFTGTLTPAVCAFADGLPEDPGIKAGVFEGLGAKFWEDKRKYGAPVAVMFSSEAWQSKIAMGVDKDADVEKLKQDILSGKQRLSDLKKGQKVEKMEVLMSCGLTIDGRRCYAIHEIKRNKKGEISKLDLKFYAPAGSNQKQISSELLNNFFKGAQNVARKEGRK